MVRSKCAPWKSDKQLNEFVVELHLDTAELAVNMSYESAPWIGREKA